MSSTGSKNSAATNTPDSAGTSSENMETKPGDLTTIWPYLDSATRRKIISAIGGHMATRGGQKWMEREQRIAPRTPPKSSPLLTIADFCRVWSPNSAHRRVLHQSVQPEWMRLYLAIVEAREKRSCPSVATLNAQFEFTEKFTRWIIGRSLECGVPCIYRSYTEKEQQKIRDILTSTKPRRPNANPK